MELSLIYAYLDLFLLGLAWKEQHTMPTYSSINRLLSWCLWLKCPAFDIEAFSSGWTIIRFISISFLPSYYAALGSDVFRAHERLKHSKPTCQSHCLRSVPKRTCKEYDSIHYTVQIIGSLSRTSLKPSALIHPERWKSQLRTRQIRWSHPCQCLPNITSSIPIA